MTGIDGFVDAARIRYQRPCEAKLKSMKGGPDFRSTLKSTMEKGNSGAGEKAVDRKLMDVCREMESIFVSRMLKEMRKTVHKNEWLHGGFAEEVFEDMLYDQYSVSVSKNSDLGVAKMLYNELSRK